MLGNALVFRSISISLFFLYYVVKFNLKATFYFTVFLGLDSERKDACRLPRGKRPPEANGKVSKTTTFFYGPSYKMTELY